jgi:hypothetical protein
MHCTGKNTGFQCYYQHCELHDNSQRGGIQKHHQLQFDITIPPAARVWKVPGRSPNVFNLTDIRRKGEARLAMGNARFSLFSAFRNTRSAVRLNMLQKGRLITSFRPNPG